MGPYFTSLKAIYQLLISNGIHYLGVCLRVSSKATSRGTEFCFTIGISCALSSPKEDNSESLLVIFTVTLLAVEKIKSVNRPSIGDLLTELYRVAIPGFRASKHDG